jgi:hypothetical protein
VHPEPLHTRFRLSPSGPVHIGHAALAWLSQQAARATGGTFTIRAQSLWNSRSAENWKKYQKWAKENLEALVACGLGPSSRESFLLHGMDPQWAQQHMDDRATVDWYWEGCNYGIPGFSLAKLFGGWPPLGDVEVEDDRQAQYLGPLAHSSVYAPYVRIAQIVGDITTGRNCLLRGQDHFQEKVFGDYFYALIAKEHYRLGDFDQSGRYAPVQYFLPFVRIDDDAKVSSSDQNTGRGFFLRDVLEAGVPNEALHAMLGKIMFGSVEAAQIANATWSTEPVAKPKDATGAGVYRYPVQAGACYVVESLIVRQPRISRAEWLRFLQTREVPE